jgi:guanylate kinase
VPKDEIALALSKGVDTIVKVDIQGASALKRILPQAVFVFLMPPSLEALEKRLKRRRSESSEDLLLRLATAKQEMKSLPLFDYVITSRQNKLDEVVSQIDDIVAAERRRPKPKVVEV